MLLHDALVTIGNELGVPQDNPWRDAFWTGIKNGSERGPVLDSGMNYEDQGAQVSYDVGTWIGAAIWAAKLGGLTQE